MLAHAFFPDFGGDTHFDDSERWTQSARNGVNLLQVAVHELGHALGLDHSDVAAAVMAPFYDGFNPKFELHTDDIAAIRRLYPLREGTTGATESSSDTDEPSATVPSTLPQRSPFRTRFTTPRSSPADHTITPTVATDSTTSSRNIFSFFPITASSTASTVTVSTRSWLFQTKERSTKVSTTFKFDSLQQEMLDDEITRTAEAVTDTSTAAINTTTDVKTTSSETTAPTESTTPNNWTTINGSNLQTPDLCDSNFIIDATTTYEGVGYMFSGKHKHNLVFQSEMYCCFFEGDFYWTISAMGEVLLPGRQTSADWGGLPGNIDAALTPSWAGGRTYFFKVP